jgi:hypothetical protein
MDELFPFGSRGYCLFFLLLIFARASDFFSTWVATPNLVLEGNPIAKKLGWHFGIPVNLLICATLAFSDLASLVVATTSVLVAARNFQSAWLMRSMGEERYRDWHLARLHETPITLYLACLAGNTLLTAAVGIGLVLFGGSLLVPTGIGLGIIGYAFAVALYTVLAVWRTHRAMKRQLQQRNAGPSVLVGDGSGLVK